MQNVLWTGGWDSTYRVLMLTMVRGRAVQPHYVIDTNRKSTCIELDTISAITAAVRERAGESIIAPTRLMVSHDIPEDEAIAAAYQRLKKRVPLGGQYAWLARYIDYIGLPHIDLSIHINDRAFFSVLRGKVEEVSDRGGRTWKLTKGARGTDLDMFSRFRFPILDVSKIQMRKESRKHGFSDLMEMTWFCHTPLRDRPCARCNPCRFAIGEGMGYRVPRLRRMGAAIFTPRLERKIKKFMRRGLRFTAPHGQKPP